MLNYHTRVAIANQRAIMGLHGIPSEALTGDYGLDKLRRILSSCRLVFTARMVATSVEQVGRTPNDCA